MRMQRRRGLTSREDYFSQRFLLVFFSWPLAFAGTGGHARVRSGRTRLDIGFILTFVIAVLVLLSFMG